MLCTTWFRVTREKPRHCASGGVSKMSTNCSTEGMHGMCYWEDFLKRVEFL